MSKDIRPLLEGWEYVPGHISARWIRGDDGRPLIQLRLDMGAMQMFPEGRPDGKRPYGHASLLDYYLRMEEQLPSEDCSLDLNMEACMALQQEAVQFYYRYIAYSAIGYLDGVIADTEHDLNLFDLVARNAQDDEIVWEFYQFFPYVRMMNARACSEKAVQENQYDEAIQIVEDAIFDVRDFLGEFYESDEDDIEACEELLMLQDMLEQLQRRRPKTREERLRENLDRAIAVENYERAAVLRDELKKLHPMTEE